MIQLANPHRPRRMLTRLIATTFALSLPLASYAQTSQPASADATLAAKLETLQRRIEALEAAKKQVADQSNQTGAERDQLARKVTILTDEVARLRESLVVPESDVLKSKFGMGPAASKIYGAKTGISLGGYGEFFFDAKVADKVAGKDYNFGDLFRYIQYVGYKFTDRLLFNAEVEFEHATTGDENYAGKSGEVAVEFAYLEYLFNRQINLRGGLLLMPIGFVNEIHEPPFFHGNLRPQVETVIIPSTWRELGVGLHGELADGLNYKLYLVNGLNAEKFSPSGWRDGRQHGGRAITESVAGVLRLDYAYRDNLQIGASIFYGGADHSLIKNPDSPTEDLSVNTLLIEGHLQLRYKGIEFRSLGAYAHLSNARKLTSALFPDSSDPSKPETSLLASRMYGFYVEAAYDIWPLLCNKPLYLAPYIRFENYDSQAKVPTTLAGRSADTARDVTVFEAGLTFKPHRQVVLKFNYRRNSNQKGSQLADSLYWGAGFVY